MIPNSVDSMKMQPANMVVLHSTIGFLEENCWYLGLLSHKGSGISEPGGVNPATEKGTYLSQFRGESIFLFAGSSHR